MPVRKYSTQRFVGVHGDARISFKAVSQHKDVAVSLGSIVISECKVVAII